jgi:acetyltransferase-like isoleucine patch superfamily enzyme
MSTSARELTTQGPAQEPSEQPALREDRRAMSESELIARPEHSAPRATGKQSLRQLIQRFLVPAPLVSLVGFLRWRARISMRAEVELSSNLQLGARTTVSSFTKIKTTDGVLRTGKDCGFASGCSIFTGTGGIVLGDDVLCGPNVVIIGVNYKYAELRVPFAQQGTISQGVRIGSNVWIGANTTILDGSEIGDNTIVVANSLVNRRFPPNVIIQGNPAKIIMRRQSSQGVV